MNQYQSNKDMTINELITTAHEDAKKAGWWDEDRNTGELLMLIVSECGEALEAHRGERRAELNEFDRHAFLHGPSVNKLNFEVLIKDAFEDELADIVIRIADFAGFMNYELDISFEQSCSPNVGEALLKAVKFLAPSGVRINGDRHEPYTEGFPGAEWLSKAVEQVWAIANAHDIDLWRHIELKLAYNRTDPESMEKPTRKSGGERCSRCTRRFDDKELFFTSKCPGAKFCEACFRERFPDDHARLTQPFEKKEPPEMTCRICKMGGLLWPGITPAPSIAICADCADKAGLMVKPVAYKPYSETKEWRETNLPLSEKKTREEHLGIRHDNGKHDWSLVPMQHLEGMVRVLEFGKQKYAAHNWRKGLLYSRITNSLQRHLNAFNAGEDIDKESGLMHIDHILCNALFLAGMAAEHPEMDDRYKNPKEQAAPAPSASA